jgi:hypothetical protein
MPRPTDPSPTVLRDLAAKVVRENVDVTNPSQFHRDSDGLVPEQQ